jgi:hypothetical protein
VNFNYTIKLDDENFYVIYDDGNGDVTWDDYKYIEGTDDILSGDFVIYYK